MKNFIAAFLLCSFYASLYALPTDSLDATFQSGSGFDDDVYCMTVLPNDQILLGGSFQTYNGTPRACIIRLNADGTCDNSFLATSRGVTSSPSSTWPAVRCIYVQSDGKILIGGNFDSINGIRRYNIARLNNDGSLDMSFDPDTVLNNQGNRVRSITELPSGKIFVGGDLTLNGSIIPKNLICLASSGILDNSGFNIGTGNIGGIDKVYALPSGKLLVSGDFDHFNGVADTGLVRIDSLGNVDPTFVARSVGYLGTFAVRSDGKIVTLNSEIHRLNDDGSLDHSFDAGSGFDQNTPTSVVIQPDGKMLVGGYVTGYRGVGVLGLVRINADGTYDATFNLNNGFDQGGVYCTGVQSNGKIIAAGDFLYFNNSHHMDRIARLKSNLGPTLSIVSVPDAKLLSVYPNPIAAQATIMIGEVEAAEVDVVISDMMGRPIKVLYSGSPSIHQIAFSTSEITSGSYLITVSDTKDRKIISTRRVAVQ